MSIMYIASFPTFLRMQGDVGVGKPESEAGMSE
jgi:hypothetical protein